MKDSSAFLEEIARLMQLRGENPFKVRAFEKASTILAERDDLEERARNSTLTELPGIGKGIAEVVSAFLLHNDTRILDELRGSLPAGLLELMEIPGLGAKKAQRLIEELGVHSVGELEYACRENRLAALKGFGEKTQAKILEGIAFRKANQGMKILRDVLPEANALREVLEAKLNARVLETGALRRRLEVLDALEFLIELPSAGAEKKSSGWKIESEAERIVAEFRGKGGSPLPVRFHFSRSERLGYEWARTTASHEHWKGLGAPTASDIATEQDFYEKLELPWLPPEIRETGEEIQWARKGGLKKLLPWDGVRGIFHNHTLASDGVATLEEMVLAARDNGFQYIGISDHSQSAFYARGLKPDDLLEQEKQIRTLREKYPEVQIFWGIESDILADGSLDYEPKWLKKFDFVIASVHSRFGMDGPAMTERLLTAIRNPYTRFIGHITGRILLGRKPYELDMEKVIAEAASQNVAIEINANPLRLDIDWRWGTELRKRGCLVSVNPDAHETAGVADTVFGVGVARKALLPSSQVLNSRSAQEVEKWLKR